MLLSLCEQQQRAKEEPARLPEHNPQLAAVLSGAGQELGAVHIEAKEGAERWITALRGSKDQPADDVTFFCHAAAEAGMVIHSDAAMAR